MRDIYTDDKICLTVSIIGSNTNNAAKLLCVLFFSHQHSSPSTFKQGTNSLQGDGSQAETCNKGRPRSKSIKSKRSFAPRPMPLVASIKKQRKRTFDRCFIGPLGTCPDPSLAHWPWRRSSEVKKHKSTATFKTSPVCKCNNCSSM